MMSYRSQETLWIQSFIYLHPMSLQGPFLVLEESEAQEKKKKLYLHLHNLKQKSISPPLHSLRGQILLKLEMEEFTSHSGEGKIS